MKLMRSLRLSARGLSPQALQRVDEVRFDGRLHRYPSGVTPHAVNPSSGAGYGARRGLSHYVPGSALFHLSWATIRP
jgi:hypothetical protein